MLGAKNNIQITPSKAANRVNKILDTALPKNSRFPVDVKSIAIDITRDLPDCKKDPITNIVDINKKFFRWGIKET